MKFYKGLMSSILVGLMLVSNLPLAMADNSDILNTETNIETKDLNTQLDDLYKKVGDELNINYIYVKMLHMIAGGKAVYAEDKPNINIDLTVNGLPGAFDIEGADQKCSLKAPWASCADDDVQRPSKYYLPDAAYSTTAEVVAIMNSRYKADRGSNKAYFDALTADAKTTIIFCEAVLQYTGSTPFVINNFFNIYEKMLYEKDANENILATNADGTYSFKPQFNDILYANNIRTDREKNILSIVLRFDANMALYNCTESISKKLVLPYTPGYTSRENMMIAAMSLVGKVRYVWGGGHGAAGTFHGINPAWKMFYDTYSTNPMDESYHKCIKPSYCWCPIHGSMSGGDGCIHEDGVVTSVNQYIDKRKDVFKLDDGNTLAIQDGLSDMDLSKGIETHRLDGLDCSGFATWLYNQVTSGKQFDASTTTFIGQTGVQSLGMDNQLMPGDVFTWTDHIIVIVGEVSKGSRTYNIIESSPYTVKFGVAYYNGASQYSISKAKSIAIEANKVFGDLNDGDVNINSFNMDGICGYKDCGRLKQSFIDENTIINGYNKTMSDMSSTEIIQDVIDHMSFSYISGVKDYNGSIFDLSGINKSTDVVTLNKVSVEEIVLNSDLKQGNA